MDEKIMNIEIELVNKTVQKFKDENPNKTVTRGCPSEKEGYMKLWYIEDDEEHEIEIKIETEVLKSD